MARNWIDCPLIESSGLYQLNPSSIQEGSCFQIRSPYSDTQHFVVEYRKNEGMYDVNIPGNYDGMLIFRINLDINEQMVTQAVFEIAKIFETKMIVTSMDLPLSGFYPHNPFFSSPYLPVKEESGITLAHTMEIYDSLRVSKKNAQAA